MTPPRDLESIFHDARRLPPGEAREEFLNSACGGRAELRAQLQSLLASDADESALLDRSGARLSPSPPPAGESSGRRIGRYKLLQEIGEGGFGTVWMAEQKEPVRRRVALKVIKLGMDTKQVIARFEAERQALALMEHPNIAKVLDAGATEAGRPFFVMELVNGMPLLEYCDSERLDMGERLALFVQVCNAIQHAHQKGIIHRDIKPSNVLVTMHDGVPVPKVIDFGIAKATNQELTERTLFTEHQQIIGTPAYMAPEQAEMSGLGVDTRADVYALGVLLYELLTGTVPIDVKSLLALGYDEMLRAIREDEPRRPSALVSTLGKAATQAADRRKTDVRKLGSLLLGDLDWIVMKCLEKNRTRRYETASALAADIHRHLENEPVSASPPSLRYQLQKLVKRHRKAALTAALVVAALALGAVGTTSGLLWALREKGRAEDAEGVALASADRASRSSYVAFLSAAGAARKQGNYAEARRLRQSCPEPYRGWEWEHLGVELNVSRVLERDPEAVQPDGRELAVEFSPDGRQVLSTTRNGTQHLWDAETGAALAIPKASAREVQAPEGHPNWSYLSTGSGPISFWIERGVTHLWDEVAGQEVFVPERPKLGRIAIRPDGRRIIFGLGSSLLYVWDVETRRTLHVLEGLTRGMTTAAFGPNGARIVACAVDGTRIWDADTGEIMHVLDTGPVEAVAFSPDGGRIVCGSGAFPFYQENGTVSLWDVETGDRLRVLPGHTWNVTAVAFSPDGRRIASGSWDMTVRIWDAESGEAAHVLDAKAGWMYAAAFSPDGGRIVSGLQDGSLRTWDTATGDTLRVQNGHIDTVLAVACSPDGRRVVSGSLKGALRLWDLETGELVRVFDSGGHVLSVAFSPDSRRIVSGSWDKTVRIWDAETGAPLHVLEGHAKWVFAVAFSPDGRRVVSGGGGEPRLRIWNAATGEPLHDLTGHTSRVHAVAYSPNGGTLVSGSYDQTLRIWDAENGAQEQVLEGHAGGVLAVAFSPDGRRIVSGSTDRTLRVWDSETGDCVYVLEGHTDEVQAVAFSPDGRRILSASLDGTLRIWDSRLEDARAHWAARAQRDRARRLVSALFDEHAAVDPVLAALRADTSLTDERRRTAVRVAQAWGTSASDRHAWALVDPDRSVADSDVALGLRLARENVRLVPGSPDYHRTLAWALFANGLNEEALAAARSALELETKRGSSPLPYRVPDFEVELARLRERVE